WSAYSSLESELTRIDTVDSLKGMGWQSVLFSPNPAVANPYDLRNGSKPEQSFTHAAFGIRLTSRLDGFTAQDVIASLHHAGSASRDLTSQTFVLDDDPNAPRATSDKIPALKAELDGRGLSGSYVYDSTTAFLTAAPAPVLGYVSHGTYGGGSPAHPPTGPSYVLSQLAFTPADGAFFQSYESFNAYSFIQGNNRVGAAGAQALVAEWIAKGGSAALGAVEEPMAGTTAEEDQVVRMMLDGYTWAEAAWSATWQLSYVNTVVGDPLMRWNNPPIPGDINMDGDVGTEDFGILKAGFGLDGLPHGQHESWTLGDANDDCEIGPEDFGMLKDNFGLDGGPTGTYPLSNIPEPATLSLLALGGLAILRKRRL
ncbi:MAG: PEP-CTERM sorting domain-containing protein, partial [Planctomycetota bacterium]|nr:PEP-CTERM sorting domain-containing protein [Planctomycetota bacterium]